MAQVLLCRKRKFIKNEKIFDCGYQILSKVFISHEKDEMPLYSMLFPVWTGGYRKVRRGKGVLAGVPADTAVQPVS